MGSEGERGVSLEVECPHCHKRFSAELIEGSAARYRGFKCPHCRLFVPAAHGESHGLPSDPGTAA
jgi:DNA-directed RNA polymerase subunit RPC12/RpoP